MSREEASMTAKQDAMGKFKDKLEASGAMTTSTGVQQQTAPAGPPGLGQVAGHFESNNRADTVSSGKGDLGGKSYGTYQLAGRGGAKGNEVSKFLEKSGYGKQFEGLQVGTPEFDAKWKEIAKNDPKFAEAQQSFAKEKYYDPHVKKLQESGIDLSNRGKAVQEAIMSTSNQYGANSSVISQALGGKDLSKMSDTDIVNAIQNRKAAGVQNDFRSSSPEVQASVAKRIERERSMLAKIDSDEKATGGSQYAQTKPAEGPTKTAALSIAPSKGQDIASLSMPPSPSSSFQAAPSRKTGDFIYNTNNELMTAKEENSSSGAPIISNVVNNVSNGGGGGGGISLPGLTPRMESPLNRYQDKASAFMGIT